MKKGLIVALAMAMVFGLGSLAMATDFCPWQPPAPDKAYNASAEGQAFSHMSADYSQGVSDQKISECDFTKDFTKTESAKLSGYGSIHLNPDVLFFGEIAALKTVEVTFTDSFAHIDATVQNMTGKNAMASDAGVSVSALTSGNGADANITANAGNSQTLNQAQARTYNLDGNYGGGVQCYTGTNFSNVSGTATTITK